jgi:hypothetical protein
VVSSKAEDGQSARQILYRDAEVRHEGEEITVFRFKLDAAGNLLKGSVSDLHRPLRSGAKS